MLVDYPRDAFAIQSAHLMDFFRGDALNLRNRVSRVLPHWSPSVPGYSYILGMHAFGLEECNQYAQAEETGRRALALQPKDGWAVHAVTHVMEMQGRIDEGIAWLESREADWAPDNGFAFHNYWHLALYYLDRHRYDDVLALYDTRVHPEPPEYALQLLDATALFWRLHLEGVDLGDRAEVLAENWARRLDAERGYYAFNDMHAMMAFAMTGREAEAARLMADLEWTRAARHRDQPDDDPRRRPSRLPGHPRLRAQALRRGGRPPRARARHRRPLRGQPRPARCPDAHAHRSRHPERPAGAGPALHRRAHGPQAGERLGLAAARPRGSGPDHPARRRTMPELRPVDLLIEGGSVMTMDASRRIIRDGAIAVDGDRIVAVDKRETLRGRYRGKRVVDGSRHVITPGLVNSHIHFYHQMHRGMAPDNFDGNEWSNFVHAKVAPILTVEDEVWASYIVLLELLKTGSTTYLAAGSYNPGPVLEAIPRVGLRGFEGRRTFDHVHLGHQAIAEPTDKCVQENAAVMEKYAAGFANGLVRPCVNIVGLGRVYRHADREVQGAGRQVRRHPEHAPVRLPRRGREHQEADRAHADQAPRASGRAGPQRGAGPHAPRDRRGDRDPGPDGHARDPQPGHRPQDRLRPDQGRGSSPR